MYIAIATVSHELFRYRIMAVVSHEMFSSSNVSQQAKLHGIHIHKQFAGFLAGSACALNLARVAFEVCCQFEIYKKMLSN